MAENSRGAPRAQAALEIVREWQESFLADAGHGSDRVSIAPFAAILSDSSAEWLSVAVPETFDPPTATSLRELASVFAERDRRLRIEFAEELWPGLSSFLEANGLHRETARPLLGCWNDRLRPRAAVDVSVEFLHGESPDDLVKTFQAIRFHETRDLSTVSGVEYDECRRALNAGILALATLDSSPAGTGLIYPLGRAAEMVGVVTLEDSRRRGVAATLCTALCTRHFETGGELVWLDAEDERARSLYRSLGFDDLGLWLEYTNAPGRS